jgi:hypothetical protein
MSPSRRDGFEQPIEARALVAAFGAGMGAGLPRCIRAALAIVDRNIEWRVRRARAPAL